MQDRYKPRISPEKKNQSEQCGKPVTHREAPNRDKYIEVGMGYLEYMRGLEKRKAATPSRVAEPTKESRYVNYLEDFKGRQDPKRYSTMSW